MKYFLVPFLSLSVFIFSNFPAAASMRCDSVFSKSGDLVRFEAVTQWLIETGFISDGTGPLVKGAFRSLPVQVSSRVNGISGVRADFLSLRPNSENGLVEVFLGSEIGAMRIVNFTQGRLSLKADAESQDYFARGGPVEYRVVVEVDTVTGAVVLRHTNRDAGISDTARGNLINLK